MEPTVNNVNNTFALCYRGDGNYAIGMCRRCGQEFCKEHRSKYDERCCADCVGEESIRFEEHPLTDDEGVTHKGRIIKLIGENWPSVQMIQDLTDEQLEFKIAEWKRLLAEAIKTTEFFRITVCAAEFDKEERYQNKIRKLRERRKELEQGAIRLNGQRTRTKAVKDPAAELAKNMGISIEQARAVIQVLGKGGIK